ncbi:DUF302 domain-containing protein [Aestuariibius sp. 2305UL40-4]|uniref:DUF302 domain-containing protein n=1 Tax=Aestuariibius violaceus TaxID=3234132 RepID=UPI00345E3D95
MRLTALLVVLASPALADSMTPRDGWEVFNTGKPFAELVEDTRAAISDAPINIITQASASSGAQSQGINIPGNRVIGIYRNDYARRMLAASIPAGIEAPLRLYLTEDSDGTGTLSYKTASTVFAPYMEEAGPDLSDLAMELDAILTDIAAAATR